MSRPVPIAVAVLAALIAGGPVSRAADPAPTVTCRLRHDQAARVFTLERRGGTWTLSMQSAASGDGWVRLPLPGASPSFADGAATLRYHNANGGRQIALEAKPGASSMDVYVDYGLDVNVDPNLDPAVDTMNTGGVVTAVDCTVANP
jgi:hypothetical protein